MKDIITCLRLVKYTLQLKMLLAFSIIFFVLGILFEITSFDNYGPWSLGALYMGLAGIYIFQMVFCVSVSKMVQASPIKRALQTTGPFVISFGACLISMTVYIVIRVMKVTPEAIEEAGVSYATAYSALLYVAVAMFIMLIYSSISYKSYVFSLILLGVTFLPFIYLVTVKNLLVDFAEVLLTADNSPIMIIVVSYGIMIMAFIIGYIMSLVVYKKDISDLAVRYALRKAK